MAKNKEKSETKAITKQYETAWSKYSKNQLKEVFALSERYIDFMSSCKTERECVSELIKRAEASGFKNLESIIKSGQKLKKGDKVYAVNRGKALALFLIGSRPISEGMNILGSHVDSPRLDLKQNPLYEDTDLAMLETHYYGGIKNYQWVTLPLAIHGVCVKEDGKKIEIRLGESDDEPCVAVSDLLVHLSKDQMDKKLAKGIEAEDLNILVGSIPLEDSESKQKVKDYVLELLNKKYGITEEDFVSAELEVVPAGRARHYGIDNSMVMAYGHDDRVCAYTSFEALMEVEACDKTCAVLFVDKEEVGSIGATGMHSKFFENALSEIMVLTNEIGDIMVKRALANSKMLSSDVSAAFDPNYPLVMEKRNCAYLGKGIVFNKYTGARGKSGCNDTSAEFVAYIRNVMNNNDVVWQTAELGKVDQGGGGTIAYILAQYGMDVIDCGVAVLNMHSPWEIVSKADIYETKKGYKAFIQE